MSQFRINSKSILNQVQDDKGWQKNSRECNGESTLDFFLNADDADDADFRRK